ncbi:MAG: tellurite resistance protein TerA [Myxococcota bacterium]|jgi:tellurite resistance protein TerA
MELKQKGSSAQLGAFKQLKVSLKWTSAVDLDLMAFYKTKDGRAGGLFSENYSGGSLGDLNQFPFMHLSGDAGVGATGGDNEETMLIAKLDNIAELFICAVNFTDAVGGTNKVFANYDARVEVVTDSGESHSLALDSADPGSVAVICKFSSGFLGSEIANHSTVMTFEKMKAEVPGAADLNLSSKVTLKAKGDSVVLRKKGGDAGGGGGGGEFKATLRWKTSVDLDLHCFYRLKGDAQPKSGGFLGRLKGGGSSEGQIYFGSKGSKSGSPWIRLDQDSGVGDAGGDNEENMYFADIDKLEHAIIVANIYNKNTSFAQYSGSVTVLGGGREFVVPLTEKTTGSWCVVARIDNSSDTARLINVNETQGDKPSLSAFI